MSEIILGLIVLAQIAYHIYYVRESVKRELEINREVSKKEKSYLRAILSKNASEFAESEMVDILSEDTELKEAAPPENVPVDKADDKLFDKHVDALTEDTHGKEK